MSSTRQSSGIEPSVEEVRVAMALNGGVSLAVWMGGCAVELDAARRAHAGPEKMAFGGYDPGATGRTASRRIYNALCEAFGRRLSVDILTGASAGGINGSLLAAAMVWGRRLHPELVRGRWLELGDLERILHRPGKRDPRSLMDGDLFHRELLRTFRLIRGEALAGESDADAALRASAALPGDDGGDGGTPPQPPWLEVTMTDVIGTERTFLDEWRLPLVAREHAPRFRFREACEYTAPALAAAARTSASFPIAFEPWLVQGRAATRARLDRPTYGIDGGVLDNAPIRAALEMVPFRTATSRVRRYACYVNADPPQPEPPGSNALPAAPGVDDVLGYVLNLPRTAPFANQLYAVREAVNRAPVTQAIVRELLSMDLGALEETANALLPAYRRRRTARSVEELVEDPASAQRVREDLGPGGGSLAWIPSEDRIEVPDAEDWEWGVRPAQRIVYLLLDMLREALGLAGPDERATLLEMRDGLEARIVVLEELHTELATLVGPLLEARAFDGAGAIFAARRGAIFAQAQGAGKDALAFDDRAGAGEQAGLFARLFAPPVRAGDEGGSPATPLELFFRRVLAIEVVRRALADDVDVDTGQELRFVQLTPAAPTPILSTEPLGPEPPPAPAERKLTRHEGDRPLLGEVEVLSARLGGGAVGAGRGGQDARGDEVGAGALRGDVHRGDVARSREGDRFFARGLIGQQVAFLKVEDPLAAIGDAGQLHPFADLVGDFVAHPDIEGGADLEGDRLPAGGGALVPGVFAGFRGDVAGQQRDHVGYFVGGAVVDRAGAGRRGVWLELLGDVNAYGFEDDVGATGGDQHARRLRFDPEATAADQLRAPVGVAHVLGRVAADHRRARLERGPEAKALVVRGAAGVGGGRFGPARPDRGGAPAPRAAARQVGGRR